MEVTDVVILKLYLDELVFRERGVPLANLLGVLHVLDQLGGRDVDLGDDAVDFLSCGRNAKSSVSSALDS